MLGFRKFGNFCTADFWAQFKVATICNYSVTQWPRKSRVLNSSSSAQRKYPQNSHLCKMFESFAFVFVATKTSLHHTRLPLFSNSAISSLWSRQFLTLLHPVNDKSLAWEVQKRGIKFLCLLCNQLIRLFARSLATLRFVWLKRLQMSTTTVWCMEKFCT